MVGLCHVSELSDDHIDHIDTKYRAGERVTAKILKVDEQRCRISLGMKDSYMGDTIDFQLPSQQEPDESIRDNDFTELLTFPGGSLLGDQNMDTEGENGDYPILA